MTAQPGRQGARPRGRARRVPDAARALRLGQDDHSDDDRGLRGSRRSGDHHPQRPRHHQSAAAQARYRHGVPELRVVSAHDGGRQSRLIRWSAGHLGRAETRARVEAALDMVRARRLRRPSAGPALRRPAAARRACPRAGVQARSWSCSTSRWARSTSNLREQMQLETQAASMTARRDHGLCHARPERGADHVGPHRGLRRGPHPAARSARTSSTNSRSTPSSPTSSARTTG